MIMTIIYVIGMIVQFLLFLKEEKIIPDLKKYLYLCRSV